MSNQPTSFRFPFTHPDPTTNNGFRLAFQALKDHADAFNALTSQIAAIKTEQQTINETVNQTINQVTDIVTDLPVNVTQLTADYTLAQTDYAGLDVFSGSGPYTLTLNNAITRPFWSSVLNLSSGNVTVAAVSPSTVNGLSSVTVLPNQWAVVFWDGVLWWALTLEVLPQTKALIAHEWLDSYDATTGLFTASQPAYSDISGTPQLAQTKTSTTHQFLISYDATTGLFVAAQPTYADLVYGYDITANRPASPTNGMMFFDSTLHKPIWWDATQWVDATGTPV